MKYDRLTIALGLAWVLLVLGAAGLVILPAAGERREVRAEIESLREQLARPSDGPEVIAGLADRLERLRRDAGEQMRPIPRSDNLSQLIEQLSGVFDEFNLDRQITTGMASRVDDTSVLPVSLTLDGGFRRVYSALRSIEGLDRLVRIQRLEVSAGDGRRREPSRTGLVRAELLMDVFFAPDGVEAEPAGGEG